MANPSVKKMSFGRPQAATHFKSWVSSMTKPPIAKLVTIYAISVSMAHAAEPVALPSNAATLQMNAAPGKYLSWRTAIKPTEPVLLSAFFDRLQPSDEWLPIINVCLLETLADQENVCLRLGPDPDNTGEVTASVADFPENEIRELSSSRDRQFNLDLSKPIQVQLNLTAERVEFLVGEKLLYVYESPVAHHALSLVCSSSICTLLNIQ